MLNVRFTLFVLDAALVCVTSFAQGAVVTVTGEKAKSTPAEHTEAEYRISNALSDEAIVGSERLFQDVGFFLTD
ncbi:MAG: hypothetical protein WBD31_09455 [Rubripirellula sp.]